MNKSKIFLLTVYCITLSLSSCSDAFLEEKKEYSNYTEDIFKNEIQTNWVFARLYSDAFSGYTSPVYGASLISSYSDANHKMCDEQGGTLSGTMIDPAKEYLESNSVTNYYGGKTSDKVTNNPYTRIRSANDIIEKIDRIGYAHMSKEFCDRMKGQAYFFRAWQHFDLLRNYGGIPYETKAETPETVEEGTPRGTVKENVEKIVADFETAASLLPDKWQSSADDYGRFTRAAALAMKSRVLLYFASPVFNSDWENASNYRWKSALDAGLEAESALTSAGYGLYGSSAKDWADMFLFDNATNAANSEAILVFMTANTSGEMNINNGWEKNIRVKSQGGGGGVSAPKGMIDLFPLSDGKRPTIENGYNDEKFYLNRDPRFYRTFAFSGSKWGKSGDNNAVIWLYSYNYKDAKTFGYSDDNSTSSPVVVRKMSNPQANQSTNYISGTDILEYRYSELILNIAECYAAMGNTTKCYEYLGKLRQRVGIPQGGDNYGLGNSANRYEALAACLYERQIELAYEGKRFWDIRRWMLYEGGSTFFTENTCSKLGIAPLVGTARIGKLWKYKVSGTLPGANVDPLASKRPSIAIDPDASATDFQNQLRALETFYDTYFSTVDTPTPMDKDSKNNPLYIDWKGYYYIHPIHKDVLIYNPWLKQTIGWKDQNGSIGAVEYRSAD